MEFWATLRQQLGSGSRSDALKPLAWGIGILVLGLIGLQWKGASNILLGGVFVLLLLGVIAYGYAYFYFMKNDPSALRSERFAIQKLAIDKGIYGDDVTGAIDGEARTIPVRASEEPARLSSSLDNEDSEQ